MATCTTIEETHSVTRLKELRYSGLRSVALAKSGFLIGLRILAMRSKGASKDVLYDVIKPSTLRSPLAMLLRGGLKDG